MKMPTMPKWWKHWYWYQAMHASVASANVLLAYFFPGPLTFLSWMAVGFLVAAMLYNKQVFGLIACNRDLIDCVQKMGDLKAEEIAVHMNAEYMRATGHPDSPPLAPTKH